MVDKDFKYLFYLFGLEGADKNYRACRKKAIEKNREYLMDEIKYQVDRMKEVAGIETIWLFDNHWDTTKAFYASHNGGSIETCACFKDMLERDGILMWKR